MRVQIGLVRPGSSPARNATAASAAFACYGLVGGEFLVRQVRRVAGQVITPRPGRPCRDPPLASGVSCPRLFFSTRIHFSSAQIPMTVLSSMCPRRAKPTWAANMNGSGGPPTSPRASPRTSWLHRSGFATPSDMTNSAPPRTRNPHQLARAVARRQRLDAT